MFLITYSFMSRIVILHMPSVVCDHVMLKTLVEDSGTCTVEIEYISLSVRERLLLDNFVALGLSAFVHS